jgi:polyhydroxyalkanoate synthesis regulator phasin
MNAFNDNDFQRSLVMYLDGALSKEESRDFLDNVMQSPEQMARLQQEKSFREILRQKVGRRTVSPALVQSIKSKIGDTPSSY